MGEQLEELRKWAAENWPRWDANAEPWTNFSNLMSTLTHDAVMIMIKVLEKHGWEVVAVVADGATMSSGLSASPVRVCVCVCVQ